jgi:intermembrane space import and assembly protein 40
LEEEADQQGAFNPETGEINWDCPCLGGMAHGPCGEQFKAAFSCFVYSTEEPKGMDCIDKFKYVCNKHITLVTTNNQSRDMQNCFREYPEVYGSELDADDEDDAAADDMSAPASEPNSKQTPPPAYEPSTSPAKPDATLQPSSNGTVGAKRVGQDNNSLVPDNYKPTEVKHNPTFDARGDMSALESEKSNKKPAEGDSDTQRANRAKEQVKDQAREQVSESERMVPKAEHDAEANGTQRLGRK